MRRTLLLRTTSWLLALASLACGGDDGDGVGPHIDRALVAGVYDANTLTFDPQGSLEQRDILAGFAAEDRPVLTIGRTDDRFQLRFRDPVTGLFEEENARYTLLAGGVRLNFSSESTARRLLLPNPLDLTYVGETEMLQTEGNVSVPLARLRELVPEWAEEPLTDPVPGRIVVQFVLNRR